MWYKTVTLDIGAEFKKIQPCPLQAVTATYAWTGLNGYIKEKSDNSPTQTLIEIYSDSKDAIKDYTIATGTV